MKGATAGGRSVPVAWDSEEAAGQKSAVLHLHSAQLNVGLYDRGNLAESPRNQLGLSTKFWELGWVHVESLQ